MFQLVYFVSGPAFEFLKIHSISFGGADKFKASNALIPAFCDAMDLDSMGYPKVGASNYWLSSEVGAGSTDYMKIDLGCNIMINSVKVSIENIIYN